MVKSYGTSLYTDTAFTILASLFKTTINDFLQGYFVKRSITTKNEVVICTTIEDDVPQEKIFLEVNNLIDSFLSKYPFENNILLSVRTNYIDIPCCDDNSNSNINANGSALYRSSFSITQIISVEHLKMLKEHFSGIEKSQIIENHGEKKYKELIGEMTFDEAASSLIEQLQNIANEIKEEKFKTALAEMNETSKIHKEIITKKYIFETDFQKKMKDYTKSIEDLYNLHKQLFEMENC